MFGKVFWEVLGYIGTVLVIFSMTMTSVVKLRLFNICGSVISLIYAVHMNTWPVVFLNCSLVAINSFQVLRASRAKRGFNYGKTSLKNETLHYFFQFNKEDIKKYFPDFSVDTSSDIEAHVVYIENEIAGVLAGKRKNDMLMVEIDYTTLKFRDLTVASFLFPKIKDDGINLLQAKTEVDIHEKYLKKMGFKNHKEVLIKTL